MDIIFHEKSSQFHLFNDEVSLVMGVLKNSEIGTLYYGKRIHDKENYSYLIQDSFRPLVAATSECENFSLELTRQEYPTFGKSDLKTGAYELEFEDGSKVTDFKYVSHEIYEGKKKIEGLPGTYSFTAGDVKSLEIVLRDEVKDVELILKYSIFKDYPAITKSVTFKNGTKENVNINKALSLNLDLPDSNYQWMQFSGNWGRERRPIIKNITAGITSIESKRGHSSAVHNPFVILKRPDANEHFGDAIGFSFVYSGNFQALAEGDTFNGLRFMMGINPTWFCWPLKKNECFNTPEVVMVYSGKGLNYLSQTYHKLYRKNLSRGQWKEKERPILLNNWEATEMTFDEEKILNIARKGKEVGVELFVLDDGWFGKRNNDYAGLGDWFVNKDKLPEGITGLAKKINDMGLMFGLWIEPEMVNPDSDLYRSHPDWVLSVKGRPYSLGRHQMVLDYSKPEVVDYIYEMLYKVISEANISYIKWDMNRSITECYSQGNSREYQGTVYHRYIMGVYSLYERLMTEFPNILFESCASGGGRFDAGMLHYAPQAWCSDDTDGHERVMIQYGSSYGYPVSSMGAHVSVIPNQQTGRSVDIESRANIAYFGTFGYELDLQKLSDEEIERVKKQVEFMKAHRGLIQSGDLYRLSDPFNNNVASWMVVAEDKSEAVIAYYKTLVQSNEGPERIYPTGLDPEGLYKMNGNTYYGDELMNVGIMIEDIDHNTGRRREDFSSDVFYLTK